MRLADAVMRVPRQWKVFQLVYRVAVLGCDCHTIVRIVVYNLN